MSIVDEWRRDVSTRRDDSAIDAWYDDTIARLRRRANRPGWQDGPWGHALTVVCIVFWWLYAAAWLYVLGVQSPLLVAVYVPIVLGLLVLAAEWSDFMWMWIRIAVLLMAILSLVIITARVISG